ncbi:MAG: response regulator transcription factor [Bacteroidales bacterium]|nr:response regulator transcription factor [Bacteroidales bacterium]
MIRSIIIDDEEKGRNTLRNFLKKYCNNISVVAEGDCVKSGLEKISTYNPDLVFLDIQMPDGTGFNLLEKIKEIDFKVIFVTAYDQYALKAFKFSAIDYLLKPIDPEKLIDAVNRLSDIEDIKSINKKLEVLVGNNNRFEKIALPTVNGVHLVKIKDIIRCESESNYTTIFLATGKKILVTKTLKEYDEMLTPMHFYRVHQSHLINLAFVEKYHKGEGGFVIMEDGSEIEVARRRKEGFLSELIRF